MRTNDLRKLILASMVTTLLFTACVTSAVAQGSKLTLKWQKVGCLAGEWCQTGWYASPAVADLDGDGRQDVIWSAYSIWVVDGATGNSIWSVASGHDVSQAGVSDVGRTWPGVVVADVDNNGRLEVVTAHGGGYISVYDRTGHFYSSAWPKRPYSTEVRGLAVYDLDGDGDLEIAATYARQSSYGNIWVYHHDGSVYSPKWPQLSSDSGGYAWGIYNANLSIGELDRDGRGELVVPSDTHYICAFQDDGTQIPANTMYGSKDWNKVGVWVDLVAELRGWGNCGSEHRPNFAAGPAVIADVNGDGTNEVVAVGNVHDCGTDPYTDLYNGPYIFNADRSRFKQGAYDWIQVPTDTGAPLSEDYSQIENCQPNPVVADIDSDGSLEILYPSYDGKVHCYWLDKTEHGNWPYSVNKQGEGFYRFASEPAVADLDDDGQAEIIFGSWTQKGSSALGKLHILDSKGNLLTEISVPQPREGETWNGILGAPTLADIDGDSQLEVVVGTAHTGLCAYDLSNSANARVLWGTGRGNMQRTGSYLTVLPASLALSSKKVDRSKATPGETLHYTIDLRAGPGAVLAGVRVTDTLPAELTYAGSLSASSGSYGYAGGVVTCTGRISRTLPVSITFGATVRDLGGAARTVVNQATIDASGQRLQRSVTTIVNGKSVFVPMILKGQ